MSEVSPVNQAENEEQAKRIRRTVFFLVATALCFYFGFIIATGLKG